MPQPMNANNGKAPMIQILPEEMVQVHLPPNHDNQAPVQPNQQIIEPQPAPELPVPQITEQQQAPASHLQTEHLAHHIQALQQAVTIPIQIRAAAPTQPFSSAPIKSVRCHCFTWKKYAEENLSGNIARRNVAPADQQKTGNSSSTSASTDNAPINTSADSSDEQAETLKIQFKEINYVAVVIRLEIAP
ncbi:unnamed protein product [Mytilus coruscus]|uniref:Uncharacterized protein n=1 Tax=Mytilus coruscus TaxID=42192 RepID=A0A6J8CKW8_MYTCO|nr:unnamed protein product [Mytilus coruscus]